MGTVRSLSSHQSPVPVLLLLPSLLQTLLPPYQSWAGQTVRVCLIRGSTVQCVGAGGAALVLESYKQQNDVTESGTNPAFARCEKLSNKRGNTADMASTLEMSRTFKKKDPESYQRIVKRLYCQEVGVDYEENLFLFSETPRKDSTGCLSVIMTGRSAGADQDMTEARVGSLYQVVEFLGLGRNVVEEGIFRKTGTVRKQQELLERIERGEDLELEDGHYTTHECASVLKTFLANLTEPLVTAACYKAHLQVADIPGDEFDKKLLCTQLLLELIPLQYFRLLKDLLFLLNGVAQRQEENKMTSSNLGMMFREVFI